MRFDMTAVAALMLLGLGGAALAHEEKLEGSEWGVIGDKDESQRYISFAGSGRVFGHGGCNRFSGSYEQHDERLTISPIAATKMACPPEQMTKETEFFDMLSKVRGVRVDHSLLLFLDESGADLRALTRRGGESGPSTEE